MVAEKLTTAPLTNVFRCMSALKTVMERPEHLPGIITFYGPPGWGKSTAAAYAANKTRAYYIEAKSSWTGKALLLAICREMGISPARTIYEMTEQVAEQLVLSGRPLIIDEMDHLIKRGIVEIIRDIYESSGAPILLIGEEQMPARLRRWERFHGRMLDWVQALPATIEDVAHLARLYAPEITIQDDLLTQIHRLSRGSVRYTCVNIEKVRREAINLGLDQVGLAEWGDRELYTGHAPERR